MRTIEVNGETWEFAEVGATFLTTGNPETDPAFVEFVRDAILREARRELDKPNVIVVKGPTFQDAGPPLSDGDPRFGWYAQVAIRPGTENPWPAGEWWAA